MKDNKELLTKSRIKRLRELAFEIRGKISREEWDLSHSSRVVIKDTAYVIAHARPGISGQTNRQTAFDLTLAHNHIHQFIWAFLELTGGSDE